MDWKQKLGSRKMWACVVGVGMGIALAFGLDEGTISTIAGAVTSLISILTYVITEGKVDAAAVNQAYVDIDSIVQEVRDALRDETAPRVQV